MNKKRKTLILQNIDKVLLIAIIALLMGGMVMLVSASMPFAEKSLGDPFAYLYKQSSAVFLGIIGSLIFFLTPSQYWEKLGILTPIFAIGLLSLVLFLILG